MDSARRPVISLSNGDHPPRPLLTYRSPSPSFSCWPAHARAARSLAVRAESRVSLHPFQAPPPARTLLTRLPSRVLPSLLSPSPSRSRNLRLPHCRSACHRRRPSHRCQPCRSQHCLQQSTSGPWTFRTLCYPAGVADILTGSHPNRSRLSMAMATQVTPPGLHVVRRCGRRRRTAVR